MCKRLDLTTWKACGNKPIVDFRHYVCEEHVQERIDDHKYHQWNFDIIKLTGTVRRREAADVIMLEIQERGWYDLKYQLKPHGPHKRFVNKLYDEMRELNRSIRYRFNWDITYETLRSIRGSDLLCAMNFDLRNAVETAAKNDDILEAEQQQRQVRPDEGGDPESEDMCAESNEGNDTESEDVYAAYCNYPAEYVFFDEVRTARGAYSSKEISPWLNVHDSNGGDECFICFKKRIKPIEVSQEIYVGDESMEMWD